MYFSFSDLYITFYMLAGKVLHLKAKFSANLQKVTLQTSTGSSDTRNLYIYTFRIKFHVSNAFSKQSTYYILPKILFYQFIWLNDYISIFDFFSFCIINSLALLIITNQKWKVINFNYRLGSFLFLHCWTLIEVKNEIFKIDHFLNKITTCI